MAAKSAPKIQRWIDLLVALLKRRYAASFEELARDVPAYSAGQSLDTRRRMFERDKDELRSFGIPVETIKSPEGETVGYRLQAGHFYLPYLALRGAGAKPPASRDRYGYRSLAELTFEPEELAAVAAAAGRVRELGDPILAEHAEFALRKLACDLPVDATGDTAVAAQRPRADRGTLVALDRALETRKRVTFRYHTMGTDAVSERTVEPLGLFFLNQHWYLAARSPGEDTVKNYRLSRIEGVAVNAKTPGSPDYVVPDEFDLREHARSRHSWELGAGDAIEATVEFRARTGAASAALRLGEAVPGESTRRLFRVRRADTFARWLLAFAGDVVPVSPPELVEEFRSLARATLEHHRGVPSS